VGPREAATAPVRVPEQQPELELVRVPALPREAAWALAEQVPQRVGEVVGPAERQLPKGSARLPRVPPSKSPPGRGNPKASEYPDKP
jgi:hypothetical protein